MKTKTLVKSAWPGRGIGVQCLVIKKDDILAKKREYQRNYRAKKKIVFNVNHDDQEALDSGLLEPEDALHGIEDIKSLNCVIAD